MTTMKSERFDINDKDYFEVSVFRYRNEMFVNLRSIKVHINDLDYDNKDPDLRNEIKDHLREQSNVDHINYISKRLNQRNWFNVDKTNIKSDACTHDSDNESNLLDDHSQYIPDQLIKTLLVITPEQYELDDMETLSYYPIYKFFGKKKSPFSYHCVHFDVLVYILMNRFPRIRADLTRLLTIEIEIAKVTNQTIQEIAGLRLRQLEIENERLRGENQDLIEKVNQLEDMLVNMNQSAKVAERRHNAKLNEIRNATIGIHNKFATMQVKDIKQHKTNDVLILYTSAEKPRDEELRDNVPEGYTWISTFNGQRLNFVHPHVPRDRHVLLEIQSNRLDSFKTLLDKPNVSEFIRDRTKYRDILVETTRIPRFIELIRTELERDDNYREVNNLEVVVENNPVNNEEIQFKLRLMQQFNPCLIQVNRYKRRLYCEVNDELVLIENVEHAENYIWKYKYGPNGRMEADVDLKVLKSSKFTDETETRINYE